MADDAIPRRPDRSGGDVLLRRQDLEDLLSIAAERGANAALRELGLDGPGAAADVRELRALIAAWREVRSTAMRTVVRVITQLLLMALIVGLTLKMGWIRMGGGQ